MMLLQYCIFVILCIIVYVGIVVVTPKNAPKSHRMLYILLMFVPFVNIVVFIFSANELFSIYKRRFFDE